MPNTNQTAAYLATVRQLLDNAEQRLAEGSHDKMLMNVKSIQSLALIIIDEADEAKKANIKAEISRYVDGLAYGLSQQGGLQ